jgi:FkbM family methyltransferase
LELLKTLARRALKTYCHSGLRGRSRALAWLAPHVAPRGGAETVQIGAHAIQLDHRVRAMRLMAYGLYEPAECSMLSTLAPVGGVVFDVGANIGYLAAHFARAVGPEGRVYAFEPSPACLPSLRAVAASAVRTNIKVIEAAVGETTRRGTYYETQRVISHGFGRLDVRPSDPRQDITEHEVAVVSLDDFAQEEGLERIDLVKIDVEGAERQVLAGMARLFARGLRPALLIEVTVDGQDRSEAAEIGAALQRYGYASYLPGSRRAPVSWGALPDNFHNNLLWLCERNGASGAPWSASSTSSTI